MTNMGHIFSTTIVGGKAGSTVYLILGLVLESGKDSQEKKKNHIKGLLVATTDCEPQYLIRLLQTKLRIGLAEQTLLAALGQAAVYTEEHSTPPPNIQSPLEEAVKIVKQVYSLLPVYDKIVPALLSSGVWNLLKTCNFIPGVPIGPMLAKPTKGVSEIVNKFQDMEFTCEYKYDGERAQIHYMENGSVEIYSRNAERNTGKFPDVVIAVSRLKKSSVRSFVLDCELVAYDREKQKILPFQILSTRARKNVAVSDIKVDVCIFAFDILYLNGQPLLQEQLKIRREFCVESKEFQVLVTSKGVIKLEEWSVKTMTSIQMGRFGAVWMVNMTDKLMGVSVDIEFSSKFNESCRAFLVQQCSNRGGRYLAVSDYSAGKKQGAVMIPAGKYGHGWQILNQIFQEVVSFLTFSTRSVPSHAVAGVWTGVSFAQVTRSSKPEEDAGGWNSKGDSDIDDSRRLLKGKETYKEWTADLVAGAVISIKVTLKASIPAGCCEENPVHMSVKEEGLIWNHVLGLRRQIDELVDLLRHKKAIQFVPQQHFKCDVCGFLIKPKQASAHQLKEDGNTILHNLHGLNVGNGLDNQLGCDPLVLGLNNNVQADLGETTGPGCRVGCGLLEIGSGSHMGNGVVPCEEAPNTSGPLPIQVIASLGPIVATNDVVGMEKKDDIIDSTLLSLSDAGKAVISADSSLSGAREVVQLQ
ncbi:DNA ligase 1 [Morella rubra]|uniref:DNA ligase n=1 Tax=Morella rubra TaxID=262757 RepID=A0A6A1WSK4_9ROSI|nr:DNA ligase 1 [Morella rubra]